MRLRYATCLALFAAVLFSACSKEKSFEQPNGGNTSNDLLVKYISVSADDSSTAILSYDSKKRLSTVVVDGISDGSPYHSYKRYVWDSSVDRILQVVSYEDGDNAVQTDTTRKVMHYPSATALEYDYAITSMEIMDEPAIDSSVFTYSGSQITQVREYVNIPGAGIENAYLYRTEFTYNSDGNVGVMNLYEADLSSPSAPVYTIRMDLTYSNDPNYLWVTDNAAQNYLLNGYPGKSNKYARQLIAKQQTGSGDVTTITNNYVMGTNGKPASGTSVLQPDGLVVQLKFFYQ